MLDYKREPLEEDEADAMRHISFDAEDEAIASMIVIMSEPSHDFLKMTHVKLRKTTRQEISVLS